MARIGLNVSVSGLTGFLIIRWVKASTPLAEFGRSAAFTYPYDNVYTINNVTREVYIVQLWRSDDGTALTQLIKDWSIDASLVNTAILKTYQYKVDRGWDNTSPVVTGPEVWQDPTNGSDTLIDERLDGFPKSEMIVHQSGYGRLLDEEYELRTGGGIILNFGRTFDTDVPWSITVSAVDTVSVDPGPTGGGAMFERVVVISEDRDFDDGINSLANSLGIANWGGNVGTITFPDLTLIADGTHTTLTTQGGSQKYLKLQFDAGDTVKFLNQDVNVIYLAKNEKISLYFIGGVCYVIDYNGRALQRGSILPDYDSQRAANSLACILADESTGELLESDYPGLYAFVEGLASGKVNLGSAVGQWSYTPGGGVFPNKRYFGIQTTAPKKIRVPHLSGMTIKLGATPGAYEADNVGTFSGNLTIKKGYSYTGSPNNATHFGNGDPNHEAPENIPFTYTAAIPETRVKSVNQIPYIVL